MALLQGSNPTGNSTHTGQANAEKNAADLDVENGTAGRAASLKTTSTGPVYQDDGVTKIEALCEWAWTVLRV